MNTPTNINAGECSPASPCSAVLNVAIHTQHVPNFANRFLEFLAKEGYFIELTRADGKQIDGEVECFSTSVGEDFAGGILGIRNFDDAGSLVTVRSEDISQIAVV